MVTHGSISCTAWILLCTPWVLEEHRTPDRQVAVTFYGWDRSSGEWLDPGSSDRFTHHFLDPWKVDPRSPSWIMGELEQMGEAGIDIALFAVGAPASEAKTGAFLQALDLAVRKAAGAENPSVRAGLLLDLVQLATFASRDSGRVVPIDLTLDSSFELLLATIDDFFAAIPDATVARVDGRPLIVVHHKNAVDRFGDDLWQRVAAACKSRMKVEPFIVLDATWTSETGFPRFDWTAPLRGAQTGLVATLGPGYDDTHTPGRTTPVRRREEGAFYVRSWQEVLACEKARLAIIESWNEHQAGTGIEETLETGRTYVELTREWSARFRRRDPPGEPVATHGLIAPSRHWRMRPWAGRRTCEYRPWFEGSALVPAVHEGETVSFARSDDGRPLLTVDVADEGKARVRFDVTDAFAHCEELGLVVRVQARARAGSASFSLRSINGGELGAMQPAMTEPSSLPSDRFVEVEWPLPSVFLGNALDDADIELCADGSFEIASIKLERTTRVPAQAPLAVADSELIHLPMEEMKARIAAAAAIGVSVMRLLVALDEIEKPGGALLRSVETAVKELVEHGIEPMVALGLSSPATPAPEAWIAGIRDLLRRLGPALRYLEILPGFETLGIQPFVYARMLLGIEREVHELRPDVVLCLGALDHRNREALRQVETARASAAFDVVIAEISALNGELTGKCLRLALRDLREVLSEHGDDWKPLWVVAGAGTTSSPYDDPRIQAALGSAIRRSWGQNRVRQGQVGVYLDPELPIEGGIDSQRALCLLESQGFDAHTFVPEEWRSADLHERFSTILLPHGEVVARTCIEPLVAFIDQGGLCVHLGGVPFLRTATFVAEPGTYRLDASRTAALQLQEELLVACPPTSKRVASLMIDSQKVDLGVESEFFPLERRTGRPRRSGVHGRYLSLWKATADGSQSGGDAAGLWLYYGARAGGFLSVSLRSPPPPLGDEAAKFALRKLIEERAALGVDRWIWSDLVDTEKSPARMGILRPDCSPRPLAGLFIEHSNR